MKSSKTKQLCGFPSHVLLFEYYEHLRYNLTNQFVYEMKGHLSSLSSFAMQWQMDGRLDRIVCAQMMDFINENS